MGRRGPPQSGQKERDRRGDDVYQDLADNVWRHQQCWERMGINPKTAGYKLRGKGHICNSCDAALANEFVWKWHLKCAGTLRKWAVVLDELVNRTFELVKCALIESRGNAVLDPGELARLCPDRVEAFQRSWEVARTTIEQDDTHPRDLYVPPLDASQFKDLAGSFQLWLGHPNQDCDAMDERAVAKGQTRLNLVRPVPWLDLATQTDLFQLAKRAALGAHSARAARDRAEWHDQKRVLHGDSTEAARRIGTETNKAAPTRVAEQFLLRQIPREERHVCELFTALLKRCDLSPAELRKCRGSDDFLAECVLNESALRLYQQNKHQPDKNQLARTLLMPDEFAAYQQDPKAWNLGQVFEEKLKQYRDALGRWEGRTKAEANCLRVGRSRSRSRALS